MSDQRVFGPVPSRRLGRSLGINNVPPKKCTYSCVYCQLGNLGGLTGDRDSYFDPDAIYRETSDRIRQLARNAEPPDYLTIVPDGEPTLDANLGRLIELLKPLGIKIAVISNSSTLHMPRVREELGKADWVSVKIDSVRREVWKRINRPYGIISLDHMLSGLAAFSRDFRGTLVSETMLVREINDTPDSLQDTAQFLAGLGLDRAFLAIPTRPPAEAWVRAPDEGDLLRAYQLYQANGLETELLVGYEGNQFSSTGDPEQDLLGICAVHPMRRDAAVDLLQRSGADQTLLEMLVNEDKLVERIHQGRRYYLRKLKDR